MSVSGSDKLINKFLPSILPAFLPPLLHSILLFFPPSLSPSLPMILLLNDRETIALQICLDLSSDWWEQMLCDASCHTEAAVIGSIFTGQAKGQRLAPNHSSCSLIFLILFLFSPTYYLESRQSSRKAYRVVRWEPTYDMSYISVASWYTAPRLLQSLCVLFII